MNRILAASFAIVGLGVGLLPAPSATGCAVAPRIISGSPASVHVIDESAVIVWDAATKTEHFTRRAQFAATSADFGFLVPTPTKPTLTAVSDGVFGQLSERTAPRHEYRTRVEYEYGFGLGCNRFKMGANVDSAPAAGYRHPPPNAAVQVLGRQRVGDLDATILKADDANALREWLDKNGYSARPQLVEWLKKYTDDRWVITAFKIATGPAPPGSAARADATAVRLSFQTEKPFYPYREPADARTGNGGPRSLRVFLLADARMSGTLGTNSEWPGRTVWANAWPAGSVLPEGVGAAPNRAWHLTEFEDFSSPRPGMDEVYFAPAADQASVERPPIIHEMVETVLWPGPLVGIGLCLGLPLLGIVTGLAVVRLFRRSRRG